jgi:tetratricopeptide (TPR) repeat protein
VPKLVIFRGDSVESELRLKRQTVRIGRDTRNEIVLDDKTVTRFHAEVTAEGNAYYISDLNSRNGVWINNQRIKGKTPLTLGVPATVGAYELTLEDDIGTSDLSDLVPAAGSRTIVSTSAVAVPERSAGSTTRGKAASKPGAVATAATKPAVFWSAIGVGTLVLCLATYLVVRRFIARPAPPPVQVAVVTPPPEVAPPPTPVPQTPVTQDIVAGYLEAAQYAVEDRDYEAARYDIEAALELDANNPDLLAMKKKVEDLATAPPPVVVKAPPKPVVPEVQEVTGIPRRANESAADYTARAGRVQTNMREGLRSLDQEDFLLALTRFQAVIRDQPGYTNVDAMVTEATARQKRQVDTALDNGQQNERAGNLVNAVRWYDRAQRLDPNSQAVQDKLAAVADRRTKAGLAAFDRAEVFRKRNDVPKAVAAYQEAADLLPASNEKKGQAHQWLEKLKQ